MKIFKAFEIEQFNVRSFDDRRKKVNRLIVSYEDKEGHEYRKRFEFPVTYSIEKMQQSIPLQL